MISYSSSSNNNGINNEIYSIGSDNLFNFITYFYFLYTFTLDFYLTRNMIQYM
jgi:hypothetical protein